MLRLWQLLHLRWNPFRAFSAAEVADVYQPWDGDAESLLELSRGAVVELVGEQGCGKTTLATALEIEATRRGIPARLVYLPPQFTLSRCWLRAARGELLIVDEADRLSRPARYWLAHVRIRHLFGLVLTRHPVAGEDTEAQATRAPQADESRTDAGKLLAPGLQRRTHRGHAGEGRLGQRLAGPARRKQKRWFSGFVAGHPRRIIRLAPFDRDRVLCFYDSRLHWSGGSRPLPLDADAADYLAVAAAGNGRLVQWSLYELFQCRMAEIPERVDIRLVELGVQRQRQSQTSERPPAEADAARSESTSSLSVAPYLTRR